MGSIKAVDKLREKIRLDVNNPWSDLKGNLLAMCDKIETEIESEWMRLPSDADGVPILIGDLVAAQDEQPFKVRAFQYDVLGWFAIERLGSQWNVNQLHHVKPRTLEDVLDDLQAETVQIFGTYATGTIDHEMMRTEYANSIRAYADEIRELTKGD